MAGALDSEQEMCVGSGHLCLIAELGWVTVIIVIGEYWVWVLFDAGIEPRALPHTQSHNCRPRAVI